MCPSSWEELTQKDLIFLGEHFPFKDTEEFHVKCFAHFLKTNANSKSRKVFKTLEGSDVLTCLTMGGKGHLFKFLFEMPVMRYAKIGGIKRFLKRYAGPNSDLDNIRFDEFRDAERCVNAFLDTGDVLMLNTFIAVLYRPVNKGLRELYDKLTVDERAAKLSRVPHKIKMALLLQYIAMRGVVILSFPTIFTRSREAENTTSDWGEIINMMADTVAVKQRIESLLLWDVLEWMRDEKKHKPKTKA
jgi:hypothetical protein